MNNQPTLHGDTVILRPIQAEDAHVLFETDKIVDRLTGTHQEFTLEQVAAYYARVAKASDRVDYAIVLKDADNTVVGEAVLNEFDTNNHSASFRIMLTRERFFGKGYGTQATRLIVAYGFEQLGLNRIDLEVYAFNHRAAHVYEKAGFVREGVRREALLWEGAYYDAIIMGILRSDYLRLTNGEKTFTL